MQVLVINNLGGGFADYLDVPAGTTVAQPFEQQVPGGKASSLLLRGAPAR